MTDEQLLTELQGDQYNERLRHQAKQLKVKFDFWMNHEVPTTYKEKLFKGINDLKQEVKDVKFS